MSSLGCRFSAALSMTFVRPGFSTVIRDSSVHSQKPPAVSQGLVAIEEALVRSERAEGGWCVAELLRIKGDLVLQEGGPNSAGAAEDHFVQALDVARRKGALSWELRTAASLARLRRDQGRNEDAYRLLPPIYDRFTEGFETADLRAAKALIGELYTRSEDLALRWRSGIGEALYGDAARKFGEARFGALARAGARFQRDAAE
jgi:hypothetical protein